MSNHPATVRNVTTTPVVPSNVIPITQPENRTGDYPGRVNLISVILTGDRPVIYTRVLLDNGKHVVHAVRLKGESAEKSVMTKRIGLNELRSGFPEQLALLDDAGVIKAMLKQQVLGLAVTVTIIPQLEKGIPVKIKSTGENAYNVRLAPAVAISDELADKLIANLSKDEPKGTTVKDVDFTPEASS